MEFHHSPPSNSTSLSSPRTSAVRDGSSPQGRSWLSQQTPSPPSLVDSTFRDPFVLHNRRLRSRHAGFRGAHLPSYKSSDRLSTWKSPSASSEEGDDKENRFSPLSDFHKPRVSSFSGRRINVLGELQHSPQRCRISSPRSVTTALRDSINCGNDPGFPLSASATRTSSYAYSPDESDTDSIVMNRESLCRNRLILSSPFETTEKRRAQPTMSNSETIKYIEHLESQLASCQNELKMAKSPSMQPQGSKTKALHTELKVLKRELAEWERKFESRVQEEITARSAVESKQRARVHALESQSEADSLRIKELECERDLHLLKLRKAETLKSTNRSLERRVDVLTELLAQSPTRSEFCRSPIRGVMSPTRSPGPRLSRPQSMFPAAPTSQAEIFEALQSPGNPATPEKRLLHLDHDHRPEPSNLDQDAPFETGDNDASPSPTAIGSNYEDSSASSISQSKSHRSSTVSQISSMSSQWSLPFPFSPDLQSVKCHNRQKSMRRFPSGNCTLRPLILPSTSLSSNDSHVDRPTSAGLDSSRPDFEPIATFHESIDDGIDDDCVSWEQQSTLNALEGHSNFYRTFDEVLMDAKTQIPLSSDPLVSIRGGSFRTPKAFTTSLAAELSAFQSLEGGDEDINQQTIRYKATKNCLPSGDEGKSITHGVPHAVGSKSPTCEPTETSNDLVALHGYGVLGIAMSLVLNYRRRLIEFKQLLGVLAYRIFANVTASTRFGKIVWWTIGLFFGSHDRDVILRPVFAPCPGSKRDLGQNNSSFNTPKRRRRSEHRPSPPQLQDVRGSRQSLTSRVHDADRPTRLLGCNFELSEHASESLPNGLSHSIFLWAKFSIALGMAVGLAVKHGPGLLMREPLKRENGTDLKQKTQEIKATRNSSITHPEPSSDMYRSVHEKSHDHYPHADDDSAADMSPEMEFEAATLTWTPNLTIEDFLTG